MVVVFGTIFIEGVIGSETMTLGVLEFIEILVVVKFKELSGGIRSGWLNELLFPVRLLFVTTTLL